MNVPEILRNANSNCRPPSCRPAAAATDAGRSLRIVSACFLAATLAVFNLSAAQTETHLPQRNQFIQKYCTDCHDNVEAKADLDLVHRPFDPQDSANFDFWVKVHDRVAAGEMPPKKKARPDAADQSAFLKELTGDLTTVEQVSIAKNGRAMKQIGR